MFSLTFLSYVFFLDYYEKIRRENISIWILLKFLSGDMILPKFREYNYYHEARSKPGLIIFWIRDIVSFYKKESQMFIDSDDINIYEINRIDIVVSANHGQRAFHFPMKI